MDYLLQTKVNVVRPHGSARMTLTWLAIARTRVSGINVSDAISAPEVEIATVQDEYS